MALPVTISGVDVGQQNSYHGPFKSSGGAFYTILHGDGAPISDAALTAFKATDPTSSFTEQDTANRPNFAVNIYSFNIYQDGGTLHVLGQNSVDDVYYARFNMATDAWVDLDPGAGTDYDILVDGAPDGAADACDIVVRSDGDIVPIYQGGTVANMGTNYEREVFQVSTDGGETFGGATALSTSAKNELHYRGPRAVIGDSDRAHCVYVENDGADTYYSLLHNDIASDDTVGSEDDTGFDTSNAFYLTGHGVSFDRSGTTKIRFPYVETSTIDLEILAFDAGASPSFSSQNVTSDNVGTENSSANVCLAVDGSTVHVLFENASQASDLYTADDQGSDDWSGGITESRDAVTINHVSCNVYDRSGTKLAQIWDDAGTVKYDEDTLAAAGPPPTISLVMAPHIPT